MPFYEYICDSCGHEIEAFQKMSDTPLSECTECHEKLRRKIFAPPVMFKGAGFYETEYGRSKHNHPDKGGDSGSSSSSSSSSGSSKDSSSSSESSSAGSAKKESGASKSAAAPAKKESSSKPKSSD